jgi:hypothetical protein
VGSGVDGADGGRADTPFTVDALADLQAGLLDDDAAARLRRRVRADPDALRTLQALDMVRADVSALGDPASAPDVPAEVAACIGESLRSGGPDHRVIGPATSRGVVHAVRRTERSRKRLFATSAGLSAAVAAVGVGTVALVRLEAPAPAPLRIAQHITVSAPSAVIPLSDPQIISLVGEAPDYGTLGDPRRRASCLSGLGYPASTQVLGARPVDINGRQGVLLVLPGDTPAGLVAVAVAPNCSSAYTGLIADTTVMKP